MSGARIFGTLSWVSGKWLITCEPHVALRLKRVFAKLKAAARAVYELSDTPENARDLEWFLERYPLRVDDEARLRSRAREYDAQATLVSDLLAQRVPLPPFDLALPAREYQKEAAQLLLSSGSLLLCDELGLGKTISGICIFCDPRTLPAIVVTETALPEQWRLQIARFAPKLWATILQTAKPPHGYTGSCARHRFTVDPKAPGGSRCANCYISLEDFRAGRKSPDVFITTYSKLAGWGNVLAEFAKSVILDEAQQLRHQDTNKYKSAETICNAASFRMGLTATPVYNYGGEIFSLVNLIRPDGLGAYPEFQTEWCHQGPGGKPVITDPKAFGVYARDSGLILRRTRSDVGRELPPLQNVVQPCEADPSALHQVSASVAELARFILGLGPNPLAGSEEARKKGEKMLASEQLINKLRQATGIAKAPFVAEFVRLLVESGERIVLFGWHRAVYDIWLDRLRDLSPALYTGTETAKEKAEAVRKFTEGPEEDRARVLIISLRSGMGLDGLQHACRTVVHGELDWSPKVHDQCTGRVFRDGQPDPVVAYYMESSVGSDPIVIDVLGLKTSQSTGILDPTAELVEKYDVGESHAKRLAEAYLAQHAGGRAA